MKNRLAQILLLTALLTLSLVAILPSVASVSWSPNDTQVTTDPGSDYSSAMTQTADERVWLFWHRLPTVGSGDIYYKTYNGASWSTETKLIHDSTDDINPAPLFTKNGTFWLFWTSGTNSSTYRIFYRTSLDGGSLWSAKSILTNTTYADRRPSVMQANDGKIWVVWYSQRAGNNDIYCKVYDGQSWSDDYQLTFNSASDREGSIIQAQNGTIFVFWSSFRTGGYEIFYKKSSSNGASWSNETQLTTTSTGVWDEQPFAVQTRDGTIWVFWRSDRGGNNYDIYYKTYTGSIWSGDMLFAGGNTEETLPSVFQTANKTLWVAWSSTVGTGDSDYDIWLRTTVPNAHDVGVASVVTSPTHVYREFGTQVQVKVDVRNYGLSTESFTILAYANSTLIGAHTVTNLARNAKTSFNFTFGMSTLAYGYYVIRAETTPVSGETDFTDNTLTGDPVTLTIVGDVSGDGVINISDVSQLNIYWYDPPVIGSLGYSPKADLNRDGIVDIFDSAILNLNWGLHW